ncbi:hypothetical protein DOTSEDRAFT_70682 [Dothistroma septosporum NZE10]|uniref:Uncharacterized protein n=1 Tax=Dothistroma septosporum (strain NZE10 / CBS 128990) TaxID=675120 RepID=N1PV15_DOTSN|nr:hypothetical protein DOTSEDRAFT_70682 [Dothistroma septosporum NZE10]
MIHKQRMVKQALETSLGHTIAGISSVEEVFCRYRCFDGHDDLHGRVAELEQHEADRACVDYASIEYRAGDTLQASCDLDQISRIPRVETVPLCCCVSDSTFGLQWQGREAFPRDGTVSPDNARLGLVTDPRMTDCDDRWALAWISTALSAFDTPQQLLRRQVTIPLRPVPNVVESLSPDGQSLQ